MIIRAETSDDIAAVRRVLEAAFGQPDEARLVDGLRRSNDIAIALVAEENNAIVGHVLFSRLQSPEGCLALAPVAVAPARQNQGIGSELIRAGLAKARQDGWRAAFVLGEPEYYTRFGFSVALAARFESAYPQAYMMALELAPGALETAAGPLRYAPPFQALG